MPEASFIKDLLALWGPLSIGWAVATAEAWVIWKLYSKNVELMERLVSNADVFKLAALQSRKDGGP